MDEDMNGEVVPVEPRALDRFASEVQTGLARYYEIVQERDALRRDLNSATLDNERLHVALDGAREHERAHVQAIVDEAKIDQHKAEIEVSMLRDEIASLRHDLAAAHKVTEDARAETAKLDAALSMIGANVIEVLNKPAKKRDAADLRH